MVGSASELRTSPFLLPNQDPFLLGLAITAEDLPEPAAKLLKQHKKEFGDTIDSPDELRKLMEMLDQTGGDMNGLSRPEFKNLGGMSSQDMLQMLIDWIQSGGPQANSNKPRSLGNLSSPQGGQQMRPTNWTGNNGGGGAPMGGGGSTGVQSGGGGGGGVNASPGNGVMGGGNPMKVDAPPGTQLKADVPWISQFNGNLVQDAGDEACYRACIAMMKAAGINQPAGTGNRIQVATSENGDGQVTADPAKAKEGTSYIDQQLAAGKPVTIGVSHKDADYNSDQITDHFVVISGKGVDEQGRVFYTYQDPGSDSGQNQKLFVDDKTGNLYDPNPAFGGRFEMSMVVPA